MRIRVTSGETVLDATLDDNATRDFASLLPLTLQMADAFEKYDGTVEATIEAAD